MGVKVWVKKKCFLKRDMKVLVAQSCPTLGDPTDCSLLGSSVYGILSARILEWAAMPSSRGSSWPRDQTHTSCSSCIAGSFFTDEPLGKPQKSHELSPKEISLFSVCVCLSPCLSFLSPCLSISYSIDALCMCYPEIDHLLLECLYFSFQAWK